LFSFVRKSRGNFIIDTFGLFFFVWLFISRSLPAKTRRHTGRDPEQMSKSAFVTVTVFFYILLSDCVHRVGIWALLASAHLRTIFFVQSHMATLLLTLLASVSSITFCFPIALTASGVTWQLRP
jgi:hypothetical protein